MTASTSPCNLGPQNGSHIDHEGFMSAMCVSHNLDLNIMIYTDLVKCMSSFRDYVTVSLVITLSCHVYKCFCVALLNGDGPKVR